MKEQPEQLHSIRLLCESIIDDLTGPNAVIKSREEKPKGSQSEPLQRKRRDRKQLQEKKPFASEPTTGESSFLRTSLDKNKTRHKGTRHARTTCDKRNQSVWQPSPHLKLSPTAIIDKDCHINGQPDREHKEYYPLDLLNLGETVTNGKPLAAKTPDKNDIKGTSNVNKEISDETFNVDSARYEFIDDTSAHENMVNFLDENMNNLKKQAKKLRNFADTSVESFKNKTRKRVIRGEREDSSPTPDNEPFLLEPIPFRRVQCSNETLTDSCEETPSLLPCSSSTGLFIYDKNVNDFASVCEDGNSVADEYIDNNRRRHHSADALANGKVISIVGDLPERPYHQDELLINSGTDVAQLSLGQDQYDHSTDYHDSLQTCSNVGRMEPWRPSTEVYRRLEKASSRKKGRKSKTDGRWKSEPLTDSMSSDTFKDLQDKIDTKGYYSSRKTKKNSSSLVDIFKATVNFTGLFCCSRSGVVVADHNGMSSPRSPRLNESHPVRRATLCEPPTSEVMAVRDRPHPKLNARSASEDILNSTNLGRSYTGIRSDLSQERTSFQTLNNKESDFPRTPVRRTMTSPIDVPQRRTGARSPTLYGAQTIAHSGDAVLFIQGTVEDDSTTDPTGGDIDLEVHSLMHRERSDIVFRTGSEIDPLLAPREAAISVSAFDIVGPTGCARFAWQKDIGVQCSLLKVETPQPRRKSYNDLPSRRIKERIPLQGPTRSLDSITGDPQRMGQQVIASSHNVSPMAPRIRELQEQNPLYIRRRAITLSDSDIEFFNEAHNQGSPGTKKKRKNSKKGKERRAYQRQASLPSPNTKVNTTPCNAVFGHENKTFDGEETGLDQLSTTDLGARSDTLSSPSVSPVPWLKQTVPELVVTKTPKDQSGVITSSSSARSDKRQYTENFLSVPSRRKTTVGIVDIRDLPIVLEIEEDRITATITESPPLTPKNPTKGRKSLSLRRNSSGSVHSASDDSDTEPTTPPVQRRGRRQAIFDSKSLATATGPEGELSPANSCDESEPSQPTQERLARKRSSVDLGINYPGDLLVQSRQKKVLIKRNTIADFANTKAYQASTASLISEQDSKKIKSSFSLLKLIDKKSHRSKDNLSSLAEVLQHISSRPSTFNSHLSMYKDVHWSELIASKDKETTSSTSSQEEISENERKRREAVWEFFKSECVFLIDHLMVLKHCFMEPMKKVQVEGHVMFAEPTDLFGNLDELCFVSHTFCRDFISLLLKDARAQDFGRTEVLVKALQLFCQLSRDGEVYHDYCLNYSKACTYLEQLRKNEDFCDFEKWCETDPRCHRLQLTDLLISPMQHCTKVPLLLTNIRKYTEDPDERQQLTDSLEKLESSLKSLEEKMKWLKNFERVQEIQQQIVWQPITELEPRAFIPEMLKNTLNRQPCERLLASPKRQLLHEGPLTLLEISKTIDMYMFLFDDILLLTKVKKPPRKKSSVSDPSMPQKTQTDGAVFTVHRQPIALDRFTIHDVRPPDAAGIWEYMECGVYMPLGVDPKEGMASQLMEDCNPQRSNLFFGCLSAANGLRNAFVLVQISRFQQIIGVFTLQAPNEQSKTVWMTKLHEAQEQYKEASARHRRKSSDALRSPDKDYQRDSPSRQKSPKPSLSPRLSSSYSMSPNLDRHRNSADSSSSSDEQYRKISNASTTSMITIRSSGPRLMDDNAQEDSQDSAAAQSECSLLGVDDGQASVSPLHSPNRSRRLSPSRIQKLSMLKAIHEKSSQSIDAVYI